MKISFTITLILGLNLPFGFTQSVDFIKQEIDSLNAVKKYLIMKQDSIETTVKRIDEFIKILEIDFLRKSSSHLGYSAIISSTSCSKNDLTLFNKGDSVLVVGYSGRQWKIIYDGITCYLFDKCIRFVDNTLNPDALREKYIADEEKIQDSLELIEQIFQDSVRRAERAIQDSIRIADQIFQDSIKKAERAIQDSLDRIKYAPLDAQGRTNYPFRINEISVVDINSADGVDFEIKAQYLKKDKTIKYLYFTVVPYNAVGDRVVCELRGYSEFTGKITGPIKSSYENQHWYWETAWYNNTVKCIKLNKLEVIYTDGTSYAYVNDLYRVLGDFKNKCLN